MKKTGLITREYVNTVIRERPEDIHKGQCGRVLIIAGSVGMAGAAVLTARGALRSGAGLVKTAVPRELFNILQTAVPQATCMDVSEGFSSRSLEIYGAVAIGPGIGADKRNYEMIASVLRQCEGTVVIDADGLNSICSFGKGPEILKERQGSVIITPHPGEGNRLLAALGERSIDELGRITAAEVLSDRTGAAVLLKGAGTVVAMTGRETYINTTGNPGMATGGSGDVLTGVIAALAAYGIEPFDAVKAGAYIHGLAGNIAAEKYGQWGMTAVEIEEALPFAFREIVGK